MRCAAFFPAASLSHVGIFASGQAYEQLVMRLLASPLPEARAFGDMALTELRKVIPSFVKRIDMPDRGGAWIDYLRGLRERGPARARSVSVSATVPKRTSRRCGFCALTERKTISLAARALRGQRLSGGRAACRDRRDVTDERSSALLEYAVGDRRNRRHKPGRGFEAVRYRFEITSDYGAFRDLQRHRMLTCQWQRLGCDLGAEVPDEVEEAGFADAFREGLEISRGEWERLWQRAC